MMAPRVDSREPRIQAKAIERFTEMPSDIATWWSSATAVMRRPGRVRLKNHDRPKPTMTMNGYPVPGNTASFPTSFSRQNGQRTPVTVYAFPCGGGGTSNVFVGFLALVGAPRPGQEAASMSGERLETAKALLARLVAIDSVSDKSNLPVIDFVEDYLKAHGVIPHAE